MSNRVEDLAEPLRSRIAEAMRENPRVTITSGRRSNAEQVALRIAHGCGGALIMSHSCKGHPTTAVPGTSNHETGRAADMAGDLTWLHANANRLGIYFPVRGENWHAEAVGDSARTLKPRGEVGGAGAAAPTSSVAGAGTTSSGSSGGSSSTAFLANGAIWWRVTETLLGVGAVAAGLWLLVPPSTRKAVTDTAAKAAAVAAV